MFEHPKRLQPLQETVRRLFLLSGNQCAFPGCSHPIITATGTYVGEMCHICAAESGGERFLESQTNEERRAFENLLLMCHDHHVETNDVSAFPTERMREIKAEHEGRFVRGLASMMGELGISIVDSVISLGGTGGTAPGAGGGGGGAIGPNARGGAGGGGGEIRTGTFETKGIKRFRIRVGQGGKGGSGEDGEDSVVEAEYEDGTIKELLRAKGGRAAAGPEGRAKISMATLANSAEVRDNLVYILGGGWRRYIVTALPALGELCVVLMVEPDDSEHATVVVSLLNPAGDVVGTTQIPVKFGHDHIALAVPLKWDLKAAGDWEVLVSTCGEEVLRLPLSVSVRGENAGK